MLKEKNQAQLVKITKGEITQAADVIEVWRKGMPSSSGIFYWYMQSFVAQIISSHSLVSGGGLQIVKICQGSLR